MNTNITDLYNRLKEQLCRIYSLDFRNLLTSRAHEELVLLRQLPLHGDSTDYQMGQQITFVRSNCGRQVDMDATFDRSKKSFANKLNLLRKSRFLPKSVLEKFHFSVILPSVIYSLVIWTNCSNSELFGSMAM
jgi:hypothetical protein